MTFRRHEIISLAEGEVLTTFPASLSAASCSDLEDRLGLLLRRLRRRVQDAAWRKILSDSLHASMLASGAAPAPVTDEAIVKKLEEIEADATNDVGREAM